ncbi:MAG: DUF1043 family protein [Gammaproteobacteria bacterium]|nr:DUF1043 family protein [Gammaproteobacteria bacterium]
MELLTGLIIAGIALFIAGIFAGKQIAPTMRRIKELEDTVEESKQQHQAYKDSVAGHFSESANLFGDITEKYRSLYEHLSSGAYDLCDRRNIPRELATSHVNILAVETPEVSPQLTDDTVPMPPETKENIIDVTRSGLSHLDEESQLIANQSKQESENTAEIIDLDKQRNEDDSSLTQPLTQQAKDYAIKEKGVINHNSLNRDDVTT